jgi:alcohol dehydrogenase class IV
MVKPFQFGRIPKIYFKNGMISQLPDIARLFGNKIILVLGKNSFIKSDNSEKFLHDFKKAGFEYHLVSIPGEPSPENIDNAVIQFNNVDIDLVIGIGGGSVIDAGKAISGMLYKPDSVMEYLEGVGAKEHPGTKIPFIAIPTTSGTGSEATKNAVISKIGENGFKKSLRHDNLVPDIAVIDPELTLHCPPEITAASGMDCFTQLTEAYLSDKSGEYTDALAMEGLKAVKSFLIRTYINGEDIEARTGMSFAALTSGICLANAGLGVVHGFASSIGGMYNIPHGIVCGTLMGVTNELNVRKLRSLSGGADALEKYVLLGKLFLGEMNKTDDFYVDGFIDFLHKLTAELNLPGLKKSGVNKIDIEQICKSTEGKNNPVRLDFDDLSEIITRRFF